VAESASYCDSVTALADLEVPSGLVLSHRAATAAGDADRTNAQTLLELLALANDKASFANPYFHADVIVALVQRGDLRTYGERLFISFSRGAAHVIVFRSV